ncbi:MAG: HEAT repeat domain-containing protein [Candidatus Anammoxibacter sp.]
MKKHSIYILVCVFLFSAGCVTTSPKVQKKPANGTEPPNQTISTTTYKEPVYDPREKVDAIRRLIVETLGKYNNIKTIPPLINAMNDKLIDIQLIAIRALHKYKDPDVVNAFLDRLEKHNERPEVKIVLIEALADLKVTTAPSLFVKLFPDENNIDVIIAYLATFVNPFQIKKAENLIVDKLSHDSANVRLAAINCIKQLRLYNAAMPLIKQAKTENDKKVLNNIRSTLIALQNHNVSMELALQIKNGKEHMKELAGDALSGYENKDLSITSELVKLLREEDDNQTKLECIKVLKSYNNSKLTLPISYELSNDSPEVRMAALNALNSYEIITNPEILDSMFYLSEREMENDILEASVVALKKVNLNYIAIKADDWKANAGMEEKKGDNASLRNATRFLTKAVGFFDNDEDLRLRLAQLNLKINNVDEAARQYEIALKKFASKKAANELAKIYLTEGEEKLANNRYIASIEDFKKGLTQYKPQDAKIANALANRLAESYAKKMEFDSFKGSPGTAYLQYQIFNKLLVDYKNIKKEWKDRAGFAFGAAQRILESIVSNKQNLGANTKNIKNTASVPRYNTDSTDLGDYYIKPVAQKVGMKNTVYNGNTHNVTLSQNRYALPVTDSNIQELADPDDIDLLNEQAKVEKEKEDADRDSQDQSYEDSSVVNHQLNLLMQRQYGALEQLSDKIIISYSDALRKLGENNATQGSGKKEQKETVDNFKDQLRGFFEKKFRNNPDFPKLQYESVKWSQVFVLAMTPNPAKQKGAEMIYIRTLYFPDTRKFDNKAELTLKFRNFNDGEDFYFDDFDINYGIGESKEGERSDRVEQTYKIPKENVEKQNNPI